MSYLECGSCGRPLEDKEECYCSRGTSGTGNSRMEEENITIDKLREEYRIFIKENEAYFEDADENSWYTYASWIEKKYILLKEAYDSEF